ncbi:MAG TPA: nucleoside kinase [Candidatus Cloacimonadota bacterium]|nr:nucleoside kinase [Candidatus Cloacimonadota bacterium]
MKIELKIDGNPMQDFEIDNPLKIKELMSSVSGITNPILAYKINHNLYVNEDYLLDRDTQVEGITIRHPEGYRIYQDSALFVLAKAMYNIFGSEHSLVAEHSINDGIYCEVFKVEAFTEEDCAHVEEEMRKIVNNALPIEKLDVRFDEAEDIFSTMGRNDLLKNLQYFTMRNLIIYRCGKFYDYYIRPLVDNTKYIVEFELVYNAPGFVLRLPSGKGGILTHHFTLSAKLFNLHQEQDKWLNILKVHNIIDLNKLIDNYDISQFILVEEALHEKKIAEIAAQIVANPEWKIVLIAGPSSSGKTTFAKRLSVQLQACKATPLVISLDDYFLNREKTPKKENGSYDFESIYALDLDLLNTQLNQLLRGESVELPKFNFSRGMSQRSHVPVKMNKDSIILMEGIHGLNDLLTSGVDAKSKVKIYVSALNQLNIDNHNRIATTDCRLIRRMVRDYRYRGYSAEETLMRWPDVREGEEKNIFPYQENADFMFNSSLTYELGVFRKYAWKMLQKISPKSTVFTEAQRLELLLSFIRDIPDSLVPYNSIIREFTNGSIFQY